MRLGARFYATTDGCEDERRALATRVAIGDALAERLAAGLLTGYTATAVMSDEQWEDEGLDRELVEAVTGSHVPVIYVNITFDADDPRQRDADYRELLERFGLRPVAEIAPQS